MDDNNKAPSNVIQFPGGKRKESEPVSNSNTNTATPPPAPKAQKPAAKKKTSAKKNLAGTMLAIVLATYAVNRYAFQSASTLTIASNTTAGRMIASIDSRTLTRDADWEKEIAENLASPVKRGVAAIQVGRAATQEEKLRWGTLEEKYTITFGQDAHEIDSISLQNAGGSNPSYILNRPAFLKEYGQLLSSGYTASQLKSVQTINDKTIEAYVLLGKEGKPEREVQFELDQHKRLLSLKVEPVQM